MSLALERLPEPILVVGGYGYGNVGDEAILAGLLAQLESRRLTVVSRDPHETTRLHGVPSIPISAAVGALRSHRSIVIGGGGLFGRDMGMTGRLLPAFALMALALARPVVIEGIDVDGELSRSGRILVPALMRRAWAVTVRDRASVAVLDRMGVRANLAPDLSERMPHASPLAGRALLHAAGVDLERPTVGLALTAVDTSLTDAVVDAAVAAMDEMPEAEFCFIPMSRHPTVAAHNDHVLAERIRARSSRLTILDTTVHPAQVLSAFGHLAAVVAMRYHAMLFAERAGTPLVPVVYAEKNARWLDERGLEPVAAEPRAIGAAVREAVERMRVPLEAA